MTIVKLETSMGEVTLEIDEEAAPITAKNFITYVEDGFYDGTIFHRVIDGFMIQGGGMDRDMNQKAARSEQRHGHRRHGAHRRSPFRLRAVLH